MAIALTRQLSEVRQGANSGGWWWALLGAGERGVGRLPLGWAPVAEEGLALGRGAQGGDTRLTRSYPSVAVSGPGAPLCSQAGGVRAQQG